MPRDREVIVPAPHERKLAGLPDLEFVARTVSGR